MLPFQSRANGTRRAIVRSRPRLEGLEDRTAPAVFTVNTLLDTVAVNLQTGKDAAGRISLRSAIQAANARPGSDTIFLPKGTIQLSIAGTGEDASATGDLDLRGSLRIQGKGATRTIVDAASLDRVFHVFSGSVQISDLTFQRGLHTGGLGGGGGLLNAGGQVSLSSVTVTANRAVGVSGSEGNKELSGQPGGNGGNGVICGGGGIYNAAGSLSLSRCLIAANQAIGGHGGAGGEGGTSRGADGINGGNGQRVIGGKGGDGGAGGTGEGGGIYNEAGASLLLNETTFRSNQAIAGNGGEGGQGAGGVGGRGGNGSLGDPGGTGGDGGGGAGGVGGAGGTAAGGGLFNLGTVTLKGGPTTFSNNLANGGRGGPGGGAGTGSGGDGGNSGSIGGFVGNQGGAGGAGGGGAGGSAGRGGNSQGGGVANGGGGTFTSTAAVLFSGNQANGGIGGAGGTAGIGGGASGGKGSSLFKGGDGGFGTGGVGGRGGTGGSGTGGGLANFSGGTVLVKAPSNNTRSPAASAFTANQANGAASGQGGTGAAASGFGLGGSGGQGGTTGVGGLAGYGAGGAGGSAGQAGTGNGGGLFNQGTATLTGITVNFTANRAQGGNGARGGQGSSSRGGQGGNGALGGDGGNGFAGAGGNSGAGGQGLGGGIYNVTPGTLTIDPRRGARRNSRQSRATNLITANQANQGLVREGGGPGSASAGAGGAPNGAAGQVFNASAGAAGTPGTGIGGGINLVPLATVVIRNTTITGNTASTSNPDVFGTFTP